MFKNTGKTHKEDSDINALSRTELIQLVLTKEQEIKDLDDTITNMECTHNSVIHEYDQKIESLERDVRMSSSSRSIWQ